LSADTLRACRVKFTLVSHTCVKGMKLPTKVLVHPLGMAARIPESLRPYSSPGGSPKPYAAGSICSASISPKTLILKKISAVSNEAYIQGMFALYGKQKGTRKIAFMMVRKAVLRHQHGAVP